MVKKQEPARHRTATAAANAATTVATNPAAMSAGHPPDDAEWHRLSAKEVFERLDSSPEGISKEEARVRLAQYGPNRLREHRQSSAWMRLLQQFRNPLIYVLLATAVVTGLLQHGIDTGVILGVVIINAIVGFIQESKAEQAIESLKRMLSPHAMVIRNGAKESVPAEELVPGDVVLLQGGDKVPADLRLFRVRNLQIEEAALTGESVPVDKTADVLPEDVPLADRRNMAFAGTFVTAGTGLGLVVETGDRTQIGSIAGMLHEVEQVETPLTRRLTHFSKVMTVVIILFCVFVFLVGVLSGQAILDMLMAAVALAVSAIPEGLPAIMTIALAIGVKRMAARNAVVRKLPAVEALGSTTVICTDKTGTLTRNEMMVTRIVSADGRFSVTGSGFVPTGSILNEQGNAVIPAEPSALAELIKAGVLCNEAELHRVDGHWRIEGDPTEGALLVLAEKAGLTCDLLRRSWPRTDVIPFESEIQYMATLHHDHQGNALICIKGSPEAILGRCSHRWQKDDRLDIRQWQHLAERMAGEGLRVLAIAEKRHPPEDTVLDLEDVQEGFALLGLVGMMDPPRPEAVEAVKKCHRAGIRVKMITGDHIATAKAVAKQVGIDEAGGALTGADLQKLDEAEFAEVVMETDIFARVSPEQKLKFVQALQHQGQIVAMTGDGVNDAPALKQADIGVAMGITGTEVAKEAAEMVLLDDNFASIERAVEEGRTVFNNLKKTILFILPTNGGECVTLVAALWLGTLLPIFPLHILWINLVTTVALAITLAFDPVEAGIMNQPPRNPDAPLIDSHLVWRILYVSLLMAVGTFGLFFWELELGSPIETARAIAVNAIVFFEVAYLFNSRHLTASVLNRGGLFGNRVVWGGIAAVVFFQLVFTYWPVAHALFEVGPLDAGMWGRVLGAALLLLVLVETEKRASRMLKQP